MTRSTSRSRRIIAGLLVALYPPIIANDLVLLTEPLSLVLLLACTLALLKNRFFVAGLLLGALVLARPSAQFLLIALGLWVWQTRRRPGALHPTLRPIALLVLGTLIVTAPWIARNHTQLGQATLVTSNGFNAAALYSPQAIETGGFVDPVRDNRFDEFRLAQFDEIVWQRDLQNLAWQNASSHPLIVPQVVTRNLLAYLELRPDFNTDAERLDGRNPAVRNWTLPLFYMNLALGLYGLFKLRRSPAGQLLIVIAGYFFLSSVIFVAWPRVRVPFDAALCIAAASVISNFPVRRRQARADDPTMTPDQPIEAHPCTGSAGK